jgi:hypothetical protein
LTFVLVKHDFSGYGDTPGAKLIFSQVFGPANQLPKELGASSECSSILFSLRSSTIKMKEAFRKAAIGVKIESSSSLSEP